MDTLKSKIRTRNPAILVKARDEEFPALAKKLRSEVDQQVIGRSLVGLRKTRNGDMLIEMRGSSEEIKAVRTEITRAAANV